MRTILGLVVPATAALVVGACSGSEPADGARMGTLQPNASGGAGAPPLQPVNGAAGGSAGGLAGGPGGYSCSFPGGDGRTILARFTIDGPNAHDDEGVAFAVLANSATAVVLARARDDVSSPGGDVGGYLVAIDRRDLSMVQSTAGVRGAGASRKGRCIAG